MDTKKSFEEKNQKLTKTFSLRFRFLATVIIAILAITVFIGGLCLYEVDSCVQTQAENFVKVTCANEAAKINDNLKSMEKSVKIMESYLMDFFAEDVDVKDRDFQEKVIDSADHMFADVTKHTNTSGAIAYYFRFDPAISDGTSGLFYSIINGSNEFLSLEPTNITIYDKDDTEHVGWFWEPYDAGKPIWMKPYHNKNNNTWMISYVIPMYFEEMFIGVIGMDFDYGVLSDQVHGIKLYENGFAHLEFDGTVIHHDNRKFYTNTDENAKKYMRTSEELVNGMTLVIYASYDDIQQIREAITYKIFFVVLIVSASIIVITAFAVKKIVEPLKKLTNAAAKLSDGNYDLEITHSDTYEIELLSIAFENMTMRLREREEQLHLSANRDSLTGLRNTTSYTSWVAKFDKEIEGKNADFGVMVLDLNDLKKTNDKYGHAAGNNLIVNASKVISDTFKRSPVFRIGGDEFLVVLQNSDLEDYENLYERFKFNCANTFIEEGNMSIPVRIASGFSRFDSGTDMCFADVFKRADDAMYENKSKTKAMQVCTAPFCTDSTKTPLW